MLLKINKKQKCMHNIDYNLRDLHLSREQKFLSFLGI